MAKEPDNPTKNATATHNAAAEEAVPTAAPAETPTDGNNATGTGAAGSAATASATAQGGSGPNPASQNPQPQGGPQQLPADLSAIVGQATWVMMHSPLHKHLFVQDLEWLLIPPIGLRQFRLWRRENLPVAFAAWALMSDEAEARFRAAMEAGTRRLAPADWRCGENVWLIDLVCPFGGREEALQQLKNETFKGRKVKTLQAAPGGQGLAVVEW